MIVSGGGSAKLIRRCFDWSCMTKQNRDRFRELGSAEEGSLTRVFETYTILVRNRRRECASLADLPPDRLRCLLYARAIN